MAQFKIFFGYNSGPVLTLLRPDADASNSGWADQAGGTTNLYQTVDEIVESDTDYIKSSINPVSDIIRFRISDPPNSLIAPFRLRYRYGNIGDGTVKITARLKQGSTIIKEWVHNATSIFQTVTRLLSSGELASITNFNDLFVEFEAGPYMPSLTFLGAHSNDYNNLNTGNSLSADIGAASADRYILVGMGSGNGSNSFYDTDTSATATVGSVSLTKLGVHSGPYGSVMLFGGLVTTGTGTQNIVVTGDANLFGYVADSMMAWRIIGKELVFGIDAFDTGNADRTVSVQAGDYVIAWAEGHDYGGTKTYATLSTITPAGEHFTGSRGELVTASGAEFLPVASNTVFNVRCDNQWGATMIARFR